VTPNERSARASIFRAAIEDGVLGETLDAIEAQFTAEWKTTFAADERDNLWRSVRVVQLLRQHMASIAGGERDGLAAIKRLK
jgi:hypothetical protein